MINLTGLLLSFKENTKDIRADLEISSKRHLPCITQNIGIYGKIVNLNWNSS